MSVTQNVQNYCLGFLIEEKECHLPADIRRGGGGGRRWGYNEK